MANYAKIENNLVVDVISATDDFIATLDGEYVQTSRNTRGNTHYGQDGLPDGLPALRGNYAGIGYIYDRDNDVFYAQQPYPSWTLSSTYWVWAAPVAKPSEDKLYSWDEASLSWVE